MSLKFIDLFAGCGGLSLGLEQAGFIPVYVNELNKDALETYLINRENEFPHLRDQKFHSANIKDCINPKFFKTLKSNLKKEFGSSKIDLICGGPPCQGFSGIGIRRSYSVDKKMLPSNHLYQDMAVFIDQMKPNAFIFENVEGLLSSKWDKHGKKGEIFENVLQEFRDLKNYTIRWQLLYSKDYGVPQNRPRVIIIGIKKNIFKPLTEDENKGIESGFHPEIIGNYPHLEEIFSDLIDKNFVYGGETAAYPSEPKNFWQEEYRRLPNGKIMKKGEKLTEHEYSNHNENTRKKFQAMIDNNGVIPDQFKTKKFAQRMLPKKWGNKGPSITVTSLADDFVHYSQARTPTVRECARMQTFPDWYQFAGKRTTGGIRRAGNPRENIFDREVPKYTQIGNAVPVKLALELGNHLKKILSAKN